MSSKNPLLRSTELQDIDAGYAKVSANIWNMWSLPAVGWLFPRYYITTFDFSQRNDKRVCTRSIFPGIDEFFVVSENLDHCELYSLYAPFHLRKSISPAPPEGQFLLDFL